jgi:glycosyltransferase involved in cell wall biosynthesis
MGPAQGLDTILDCAARLQHKTNVQFLLVGDGLEKAALKLRAEKEGLQNVRFAGPLAPRDMPRVYALADVLLLHLIKTPLFEITIPSKTVAYLASGRPIIGAIEGDTAEMIDDAHAGITCEPQNVDVICSAIEKLRAMPSDQREQLGTNARNAFLKDYRKEVLITRMEHLFRQISRSQGDKRGKEEGTVVQG